MAAVADSTVVVAVTAAVDTGNRNSTVCCEQLKDYRGWQSISASRFLC